MRSQRIFKRNTGFSVYPTSNPTSSNVLINDDTLHSLSNKLCVNEQYQNVASSDFNTLTCIHMRTHVGCSYRPFVPVEGGL